MPKRDENRPRAISVRPNVGSDLEKVRDEQNARGEGMSAIIHSWASMFTNMVKESEK